MPTKFIFIALYHILHQTQPNILKAYCRIFIRAFERNLFFYYYSSLRKKIISPYILCPPPPTCHMICLAEHKCQRPPFSILISAHTSTAVPTLPMSIMGK